MIKNHVNNFVQNQLNPDLSFDNLLKNYHETGSDEVIINNAPGVWSIDKALTKILLSIFENSPNSSIVEFGAGYSTIVFNYASKKNATSTSIISIEEKIDWFKVPENLTSLIDVENFNLVESKLLFKLGYFGIYAKYQSSDLQKINSNIDIVFIDGPQRYYGREGDLDHIYSLLNEGALIILDDAERYLESCLLYKWLKVYKGLELIHFNKFLGEKGVAILRVNKKLKRRFSIAAFSLGFFQGTKRLINTSINKSRLNKTI